jgi:hypothetical protein
MSRATTHSADEKVFSLAKITIESGRADPWYQVAQQNDDFGYDAGIDGEGVFWQDKNEYTIVQLTLMKNAAGNSVLSALHAASKLAGGLPVPCAYSDPKGTGKMISEAALILKTPDEVEAKEPGTVVWMIGVHQPIRVVGSR